MHIVEYIGGTGVLTTPMLASRRLEMPRPGDVVDFSKVRDIYPNSSPFGTIELVGTGFCDADEIHICCHPGSIFLTLIEDNRQPTYQRAGVSISGGPFTIVKRSRLTPTMSTRAQSMWNWGDHRPGPDLGVYYSIERPVFLLEPAE